MSKVIYLDQNKWIDLARAIIEPEEFPQFVEASKLVKEKAENGEWIFPISMIHFMETLARQDIGSRTRLAEVMASISNNHSIFPFMYVETDEFLNMFYKLHNIPKSLDIKPVRNSLFPAMGADEMTVEVDNTVSEEIRNDIFSFTKNLKKNPKLFALLMEHTNDSSLNEEVQKDDQESKESWIKLQERFQKIQKEHRYKAFLIDSFFQQFLFRIDYLTKKLNKTTKNIIPEDAISDHDKTMEFLGSVPSLDVRLKITFEVINNTEREIHIHDHRDVAFLATAIPYCDVVITERIWKHISNQKRLDEKYNTVIHNDLNYLLNIC